MATIRTTYKYASDLDKGTYEVNLRNPLMQADSQADEFRVSVTRNGSDVNVAGMNAYGYLYIASAQTTIALNGTVSGNAASVVLSEDCYAVPGYASLVIQLHDGDVRHTVLKVNLYIERTGGNRVLTGGDVLPTLAELLNKISAMEQATATANATIATIKADTAAAIEATNKATAATQTATVELAKTAAPAITPTASGSIITITDGAERPAVSVITHIEPVQEGSGDPSPDNVRPISGWDSVGASLCGKNWLNVTALSGTRNGLTFRVENGVITFNGTADTTIYFDLGEQITLPPGTYTMSGTPDGIQTAIIYDNNGHLSAEGTTTIYEFVVVRPYILINEGATFNNAAFKPQIERGDKRTAFAPYEGQTLTASLLETVYGGTLDWGTGVLTVTHGKTLLDGTQVCQAFGENNRFRFSIPVSGLDQSNTTDSISEKMPLNWRVFVDDGDGFGFVVHWDAILVRFGSDSDVNTTEKANNYFAANPATVVYKLAAPYIIQLTPQQLSTLRGTNNVWSSTGDTTLTYIADTQMYIDQRISALLNA